MEDNGIKITFREIYQIVVDTAKSVERIESKLESISEIESKCKEALDESRIATRRIQELEDQLSWVWRTLIGAFITSGVGAIFYFVTKGGS